MSLFACQCYSVYCAWERRGQMQKTVNYLLLQSVGDAEKGNSTDFILRRGKKRKKTVMDSLGGNEQRFFYCFLRKLMRWCKVVQEIHFKGKMSLKERQTQLSPRHFLSFSSSQMFSATEKLRRETKAKKVGASFFLPAKASLLYVCLTLRRKQL